MSKKTTRTLVSAVVILSALGLLLTMTIGEASYFKHVDEVMVSPAPWYGKHMSVHGFVVEKSIERRSGSFDYRFKVKNGDHVMLATYTGLVPDTFKDGAEVVLTGKLTADGFQVNPDNGIAAKCPSKYEADKVGK